VLANFQEETKNAIRRPCWLLTHHDIIIVDTVRDAGKTRVSQWPLSSVLAPPEYEKKDKPKKPRTKAEKAEAAAEKKRKLAAEEARKGPVVAATENRAAVRALLGALQLAN
jgi:hypothetical protein